MLTLEQYRSAEMSALYQQYLAAGPLEYMREIFLPLCGDSRTARLRALEFYAPMHLLYSMYDGAAEKCAVLPLLEDYIDGFCSRFSAP